MTDQEIADIPMQEDESKSMSGKSKQPRWNINRSALYVLEQVFALEKFPSHHMRQRLAADLGVSPRQVQVWFQNRRQRERNNCRSDLPSTSLDSLSSGCTDATESAGEAWNDATLAHAITTSNNVLQHSMAKTGDTMCLTAGSSPAVPDQAAQHMAGALPQMPGTQYAYSSVPGAYPVHPHDNMARSDAGSQSQLAQYLIHFENTFRGLRQLRQTPNAPGPAPLNVHGAAFRQGADQDMNYTSAMQIASAFPPQQHQQYALPVPSQQQRWMYPNCAHPGQQQMAAHAQQQMTAHPGQQHMGTFAQCQPVVQPTMPAQLAAMQGPMQGVTSGGMPPPPASSADINIVRNMTDDDLHNIFAEDLPELHAQDAPAHAQAHFVRPLPPNGAPTLAYKPAS